MAETPKIFIRKDRSYRGTPLDFVLAKAYRDHAHCSDVEFYTVWVLLHLDFEGYLCADFSHCVHFTSDVEKALRCPDEKSTTMLLVVIRLLLGGTNRFRASCTEKVTL